MLKKIKKNMKKKFKKRIRESKKCGDCVFYVANKKERGTGSCFQVNGKVLEKQAPKCKGKFFKMRANQEIAQQPIQR